MRRYKKELPNFSSSQLDEFVYHYRHQSCSIRIRKECRGEHLKSNYWSYSFQFFSIIVLPIALVIFFLGTAGLAASVGEHKKSGRSEKMQILAVAEQT
jgi:hypothetical protein